MNFKIRHLFWVTTIAAVIVGNSVYFPWENGCANERPKQRRDDSEALIRRCVGFEFLLPDDDLDDRNKTSSLTTN